jgi:hypothetical protein
MAIRLGLGRQVGSCLALSQPHEMLGNMTAVEGHVVTLGLTCRRHVDYGRVRSAICPAH